MQLLFNILLLVLLVSILVSSIWNICLLRRIKNKIKHTKNVSDKENYLETKYKIQFLTSVFTIIIFITGFLGYNSISGVKSEIEKEYELQFTELNKSIDKLTRKKDTLSIDFDEINNMIVETKNKIKLISKKNIMKPEIYIVKNIPIVSEFKNQKHYFKDMKTITNDKLPKIINRPVISVSSPTGAIPIIKNITNEYIEFGGTAMTQGAKEDFLDLWITVYDE